MRTFPLDIDPEQLVLWTRDEVNRAPARLRTVASCGREVRAIELREEFQLGDIEREDLEEIATVAILEIFPGDSKQGWSITLLVEDEMGDRIPDDDADGGEDESDIEIDIETFYMTFIRPSRGTVFVTANAEDGAAQARVTRLLGDILNDRHRGRSKRQSH